MLFSVFFFNCTNCRFSSRCCEYLVCEKKHACCFSTFLIAPVVNSYAVSVKTLCSPKSMHFFFSVFFFNCTNCRFLSRCFENFVCTEYHACCFRYFLNCANCQFSCRCCENCLCAEKYACCFQIFFYLRQLSILFPLL